MYKIFQQIPGGFLEVDTNLCKTKEDYVSLLNFLRSFYSKENYRGKGVWVEKVFWVQNIVVHENGLALEF